MDLATNVGALGDILWPSHKVKNCYVSRVLTRLIDLHSLKKSKAVLIRFNVYPTRIGWHCKCWLMLQQRLLNFLSSLFAYFHTYERNKGVAIRGVGVPQPEKFGLSANLQWIFSWSANLQYTIIAGRRWNARKAFFIVGFN